MILESNPELSIVFQKDTVLNMFFVLKIISYKQFTFKDDLPLKQISTF